MFVATIHDTFVASGPDGRLRQVSLDEKTLTDLVSVSPKNGFVEDGPLTGFQLIESRTGFCFKLGDNYLCAPAELMTIEHNRKQIGDWETFKLIDENQFASLLLNSVTAADHVPVLAPTKKLWGSDRLIESDPSVTEISNVFCLPFSVGNPWGVFAADGEPVSGAFPARHVYQYLLDTPLTFDERSVEQCDEAIYCGLFNCHYGHFLIDVLPRFWFAAARRGRGTKIICHAPPGESVDSWFRFDFINASLSAIGLQPNDFIILREPAFFKRLIIPHTALAAQQTVHACYGELCRKIGQRSGRVGRRADDIVYMSRSRLSFATNALVNETVLEDALRKSGVRIIYPELLSFAEQIEAFSTAGHILACAGSALHTSLFTPSCRLTVITTSPILNANFKLVDRVSKNASEYLHSPQAFQSPIRKAGINDLIFLPNVQAVAEELVARARSVEGNSTAN